MSRILNCQHSAIILHPLAIERITRYGNVVIRGEMRKMSKCKRNLYHYDAKEISVQYQNICKDDIDSCYIVSPTSGETYPLYIEVRCGKCENCRQSKISSFVQRCELESMMYDCQPLFLTLTYNNENKPKNGSLVLRDVQLFFKRFRINLERKGYNERIRYVCVGEYGSNTHRPHYHALIWNLHQTSLVEFRQIREILEQSWNKGFIMSRLVDPSDNKTFYYTSKYLCKDSNTPDGCEKPFMVSSNRNGGIGASYLFGLRGHIFRFMDTQPKFVNKYNGQVKDLMVSKYFLDKVMPSFSTSVPSVVKNAMRTFNLCYAHMENNGDINIMEFSDNFHKFNEFFQKFIYCPRISKEDVERYGVACYKSPAKCIRDMLECEMILDKWMEKGIKYYEDALRLDEKRCWFLSKLFEHVVDIDRDIIQMRASRFRRSMSLARHREVL